MMDQPPMSLKEGCMIVLHYFGVFRYPLTGEEIHRFNPVGATSEQVEETLKSMLAEGLIFSAYGYYLPTDEPDWIGERRQANERALHLLERSKKYVAIIAAFPFVRGIAISGSLSKFSASLHPDIDYFIITEAHRLWIARTFMHLFKKLTFITGHQHYFCMNYYVDTDALVITHQNMYSAIEVMTLLPVYNIMLFEKFFRDNGWACTYLPNHPGPVNYTYEWNGKDPACKKILERMINWLNPGKLNRFFMELTDRKWRRKWKHSGYPMENYNQAFLTSIHISKNHPMDYEKIVLGELKKKNISENTP